jgi:transmembrane sensor
MTGKSESDPMRATAFRWLTRMLDGELSDRERVQFEEWLRQDAGHSVAFAEAERLWHDVGLSAPNEPVPIVPTQRGMRPGFVLTGMATLAACVALAFFAASPDFVTTDDTSELVVVTTTTGETRQLTMSDGTEIVLGAASSIRLDDQIRRAELLAGEAFFDVATDPDKPFEVAAPATQIRVVGTRFDVRTGPTETHVSVSHGIVEVSPAGARSGQARRLTAGQRISAHRSGTLGLVGTFDLKAPDWRSGWRAYENATLGDVIADINRYRSVPIRIGSPAISDDRITVSFRTDQIDQVLGGLQVTQSVRLMDEAGQLVLIDAPLDPVE